MLNQSFHLAKADFLQRVRGAGFMIMLAITVVLSTLFVPPIDAPYSGLTIGWYRLRYTSAGIGLMFGLTVSLLLSLFAFYLVKNAIARDRQTHVGTVIATTHTSTVTYLIGKWASNLILLAVILVCMSVMAPIMQLLRGEELAMNLWQSIAPIWLIGLPVMSIVAGTAVLFETIPFLRGGFGNIAYFFLWSFALVGLAMFSLENGGNLPDPFGLSHPLMQVYGLPNAPSNFSISLFSNPVDGGILNITTISWSVPAVISRFVWLLSGAGIAAVGALPFDRFKPTQRKDGVIMRLWAKIQPTRQTAADVATFEAGRLTPLNIAQIAPRMGGLLMAEVRLLLKGQAWWWYAGLIGVMIFGLSASTDPKALIGVTIWPMLVWSALGNRQQTHNTTSLILSSPHPILRQRVAAYGAGIALSTLLMSGFMLSMVFSGAWLALAATIATVMFIPAVALALGTWSGSPRLFEVFYIVWWYIGINSPNLHPLGVTNPVIVLATFAGAVALLAIALSKGTIKL